MSIPERADIEIFNNFVNEINKVVKLQDEKPDQIQMLVKRLSKKIEASRADLSENLFWILKGIIAGFENQLDNVRRYFSSAISFDPTIQTYIHYIKALKSCFEDKEAYDLACEVCKRDGTHPEIYSLIAESAFSLGLFETALEWFIKYEALTKNIYPFKEKLENIIQKMPDIDESALSIYISAAIQFMKKRNIRPVSQSFNSINGEVLEVCFEINFSAEKSSQFFYDFVASDYILDIPDKILDSVTINFPPYAR